MIEALIEVRPQVEFMGLADLIEGCPCGSTHSTMALFHDQDGTYYNCVRTGRVTPDPAVAENAGRVLAAERNRATQKLVKERRRTAKEDAGDLPHDPEGAVEQVGVTNLDPGAPAS